MVPGMEALSCRCTHVEGILVKSKEDIMVDKAMSFYLSTEKQ